MRIYADESGTHDADWLVIGMLFVPDHGTLHGKLAKEKERIGYFNRSPKYSSKFKETHFAQFRSRRDLEVGTAWIDRFLESSSFFRSVVVNWSQFQGRFFGGPFESDALKKRRAHKKWAEMLLQPEISVIRNGIFIHDHLKALQGYDVVDHLKDRFCLDEMGHPRSNPRIRTFQAARSWTDANQCLQLSDLLVGCISQALNPSTNQVKLSVRDYLYEGLTRHGVAEGKSPGYWRQFGDHVRKHHSKFSQWFWDPKK